MERQGAEACGLEMGYPPPPAGEEPEVSAGERSPGVTPWVLALEAGNFWPWQHPKCCVTLEAFLFSRFQWPHLSKDRMSLDRFWGPFQACSLVQSIQSSCRPSFSKSNMTIWKMEQLRLKKVTQLAQGHVRSQGQRGEPSPGPCALKKDSLL